MFKHPRPPIPTPLSRFEINTLLRQWHRLFPRVSWTSAASVLSAVILCSLWTVAAQAQDTPLTPESIQATLDNIWVLIAAILVIFMNAGFAMLESGLCRQKNTVNILAKNLIVFALASLAFWAVGFSLMFGTGLSAFMGAGGFFLTGDKATYGLEDSTLTIPVFFLFEVAFAGTAATIVSGAVAERIKFIDFICFSLLLAGIAYPITGHWVWGGGLLSSLPFLGTDAAGQVLHFKDFAGSTVVHSVGGWAALMGAAMLGPRLGKYREDGTPLALPGHNMSMATLGCFILWIGWFGFNAGSELMANETVPRLAVVTCLAASAGGVAATVTAWRSIGKPDLSMIINGILAGLVAITGSCVGVSYGGAVAIGGIAGVIVVFSVILMDITFRLDDPVGAISVHLVNGIWGTLAVGLWDQNTGLFYGHGVNQLMAQLLGILTVGGFTVFLSFIFWSVLQSLLGLRVPPEEEMIGLDVGEHGMEAYSGFLKDTSGMAIRKE